jgi:hypothetical protein
MELGLCDRPTVLLPPMAQRALVRVVRFLVTAEAAFAVGHVHRRAGVAVGHLGVALHARDRADDVGMVRKTALGWIAHTEPPGACDGEQRRKAHEREVTAFHGESTAL